MSMISFLSCMDFQFIKEESFLNLRRLPACVSMEQAAWLLGMSSKAVTHLVSIGILRVLGHPVQNAPKFFSSHYILEIAADEKWLAKAQDAVRKYNFHRNHQDKETSNG
jgi:hypothetical protein